MEGIIYQPGETRDEGLGRIVPEVFETVYCFFKNETGFVNPTSPRVYVDQGAAHIALQTLAPETVLGNKEYTLTNVSVGSYKFVFYPSNMSPGLYNIVFLGGDPAVIPNYGTFKVSGGFQVAQVQREFSMIRDLRHRLQDLNPALYTIIDSAKNVWTDENLLVYLSDAMNEINQTPTPSSYSLSNFPNTSLVLDGAFVRALQAAAVLEIWNTMQYNDEISFVIDRAPKLQALAKDVEGRYNANREKWKLWWSLYGDDGSGQGAAGTGQWMGELKVPFQISRVLSWLPNMKNVFGI